MIRRLFPLSLAVVLIGTACSNDVDRDVLAVVNGEEITTEEFIAVYAAGGAAPLSSVGLSDPETAFGVSLGGNGVAQTLGTMIQIEAARPEFEAAGVTVPALDDGSTFQADLNTFLSAAADNVLDQSDVDGEASNLVDTLPCVSHILVDTEAEALDVLARLDAGEDFAALAVELSTDPGSGAQGGDLGCVPPAQWVPEFAAALIELEVGEISEPVASQFGAHVIRRDAPPDQLLLEAEALARQRLLQAWLSERALEADVYVDPAVGVWSGTGISPADPLANS